VKQTRINLIKLTKVRLEASMSSKLEIRDTGISVTDVLELISQGFTYERILFMLKSLTYKDIFHAAKNSKGSR